MSFFYQVGLLLWKNFVLKIRSPIVFIFELCIPLALFFILLWIRYLRPALHFGPVVYPAYPLPSSGVLAILQLFCSSHAYTTDKYGFKHFYHSSTHDFLSQFKTVTVNNKFFVPGFVDKEMERLPQVYKNIINNPANIRDHLLNTKDFQLYSIMSNTTHFLYLLTHSLGMSKVQAESVMHSRVNIHEFYQKFISKPRKSPHIKLRKRRSPSLSDEIFEDFQEYTMNSLEQILFGHLYELKDAIFDKLLTDKTLIRDGQKIIRQLLSISEFNSTVEPWMVSKLIKMVLLYPQVLYNLACANNEFPHLLTPSLPYKQADLTSAGHVLCRANTAKLNELSSSLMEIADDDKIAKALHLDTFNLTEISQKISEFRNYVRTFYRFQSSLLQLGNFTKYLPQNSCPPLPVEPSNLTLTLNSTGSSDSEAHKQPPDEHQQSKKKPNKFAGFLKIWMAMQNTICGYDKTIPKKTFDDIHSTEDLKHIAMNVLGLSWTQQRDIGIVLHLLYHNPKILYAPNNTGANIIIKEANKTLSVVDGISYYAQHWLNISVELRKYLENNRTIQNLHLIQQIHQNLNSHPYLQAILHFNEDTREFLKNPVPDVGYFLDQLDMIDNAACSWQSLMSGISLDLFRGFRSERELVNYVLNQAVHDDVSIIGSLVFENVVDSSTLPPHVRYKIRQNASLTMDTKLVRSRMYIPGPGPIPKKYYHFGFVWIQDVIERAIINVQTGKDVTEPGIYVHQFPYPCFTPDMFLYLIQHVVPLCLTVSWVYSVAMLVQRIVYEKERGLKEIMRLMGLNSAVHWFAWFITSFVQMTITIASLVLMLHYGKILKYSNPVIIFITFEVFAIATIWFSFFISVLYSKAKVAAAWAGIIYFLTYVPYMYISIREGMASAKITVLEKTLASLSSTTAFGLGAKYLAFYEEQEIGVQWGNLFTSPIEHDSFNIFFVIVMMLIDAVLYGVLVWYIEHIHPGKYGLPKPFYFPFTKTFWFGHSKSTEGFYSRILEWIRKRSGYLSVTEDDQACAMESPIIGLRGFETDLSELRAGISIHNLTKVYKNGHKKAVNNISLDLYEGQITSLLGHNGAGKTTTMSILTGLLPPTSGYALIYGHDIRTSMDTIRRDLGMCPQHCILFDALTVEEHIWFYSRLKGVTSKDIKAAVNRMIDDVDLPKKRHTKVENLSGGMQRKLSIAIAFAGGSRTVVLDEPTAGVDPYARRAIWDLLVKYKEGRTILLTTHHMDEAEILSDRIAIIANGQVKCCGSSVFLKNTFGDGYHLTFAKKMADGLEQSTARGDLSPASLCDESKVTRFIQKQMPSAYLKFESLRELHYVLPFAQVKTGQFESLFMALERSTDHLDVSSYGVTDTTLEEVFMSLTERTKRESIISLDNTEDEPESSTIENQRHYETSTVAQSSSLSSSSRLRSCRASEGPLEMAHILDQISDQSSDSEDCENANNTIQRSFRGNEYFLLGDDDSDGNIHLEEPHVNGSPLLVGYKLHLSQLRALLVKRFYYICRNRKSLFSQIILPALFVSLAMTIALSAPGFDDSPAIELTPSQYFNYTVPLRNVIPISDESRHNGIKVSTRDATPRQLIRALHLASGIGATCVLNSPFNSSFDLTILKHLNYTLANFQLLSKYFATGCKKVFMPGLPLKNFVPPVLQMLKSHKKYNDSIEDSEPIEKVVNIEFYPKCECTPDGAAFPCDYSGKVKKPPSIKVVTSDIIYDITGAEIADYFLYTTAMYRLRRYGALTFGLEQEMVPISFGKTNQSILRRMGVRNIAMVWYNHKGYHSMPTYVNSLNNLILRANLPKSKGNPAAYGITAINHPMERTANEPSLDAIIKGSDVLIAIFVIVAMSFVPASFVLFLVYERSIACKHLQLVSGQSRIIYWAGNYLWDICNYLIPSTCCIIIFIAFQIPAYTSPDSLHVVVALFLLYGWSITPMMYPASFLFKEPSFAYTFLIVINLFIGITCIVCSFLLEIFSMRSTAIKNAHEFLKIAFLIFPNYSLGRGLMDLSLNYYKNMFFSKTGQYELMKPAITWEISGRNLVAMGAVGGVFIVVTLLREYKFLFIQLYHSIARRLWSPVDIGNEDNDVMAERRRVLHGNGRSDLIRLIRLTKVYNTCKLGRQLAVDRICLGIPSGECFGLLGMNGAGKTTTFKLLTGYLNPTGGDAYIDSHSIVSDINGVYRSIGYCPQSDALFDELTAREHLTFYARLRGICPREQEVVVSWALSKVSLEPYADQLSVTLSGGNKRKLSTAIALIGKPNVLLMDEPTTGMDPNSRRFIWDLIRDLVKEGHSIVFTSHSMEECEILCTRLAIMVNGQFRCLGSPQHLKNKFGDGYTLSLRLKGPNYDGAKHQVRRFIERNFADAEFKDHHYNTILYELPISSVCLSHIFSVLERSLAEAPISDYSVSQNNLDSIFINFVKEQVEVTRDTSQRARRRSDLHEQPFLLDDTIVANDSDDDLCSFSDNQLTFINLDTIEAS